MDLFIESLGQAINNDPNIDHFSLIDKAIKLADNNAELVFLIHGLGVKSGIDKVCNECPMASLHISEEEN